MHKKNFNPRHTMLIFDSGIGGFSIYNKIRHLLPDLHYLYVFDNVAFPYGEKNSLFIIERVVKIISSVQKRYQLAMAVIACNTASTVSLPILREKFQFPIIGVVPAIKPAAQLTKSGIIGLLATSGTIKCHYVRSLIDKFAIKCRVLMLDSAELVEEAEAKMRGATISLNKLRFILYPWLCIPKSIDTVVLGCTHFSLLYKELLQVFPKGTSLIDSSSAIARRAVWLLKHKALDVKSFDYNRAFCMTLTETTKQLIPVFYRYGFKTLEKLDL